MSRSDRERLLDILDCIEAIDRAEATARRYADDSDVGQVALDAVQRHVFTIGEAVKALSPGLRAEHPQVPWSDIARMRDLIGHHYYKIDAKIVEATIAAPLTQLRATCQALVSTMPATRTDS